MNYSQKTKQNISIKYGQIYSIGNICFCCGDARDMELVDRLVGKNKIKAAIIDAPYGIKMVESKLNFSKIKTPKIILNDDITSESEYTKFTENWIRPILPHLATKNSLYLFNSDAMIFASETQEWKIREFIFPNCLCGLKIRQSLAEKITCPNMS